jgi:glycerol-3-phosphate O-acyltransferase
MDSILLGYIHYHYKLEYPFVCGSEAFFALVLIGIIIKSTNGFYYNVQNMKNGIYKAVLDSYICSLMKHNCLIEVFIEMQRSRNGKINRPNEFLFDEIVKLYLKSTGTEKKNIQFIPITINYDRVHDGESFPLELLGESPKPDNAIKILRYFFAINKPLGKVIIRYCEPVSLESYLEHHSKKTGLAVKNYINDEKATKSLIYDLGEELSYI